uniref:Uncharacterized protein n=1 Tax=Arundo donax TaxID=35708 RepID=A0A0A9BF96_ARUDO
MAARGFEMDTWMNRNRAFAEGVVVMVCPVLLAIALSKVNLKSEEHGRAIPIIMLVVAAITLVAGICPFLVCCFSKCKRFSSESSNFPQTVTKFLAPLSSACLVILACWIIHLIIIDNWAYPAIGAVIGFCIVARTVSYFCANKTAKEGEECSSKLENSLDFSTGVAALLFIGLEGLALEGQINRAKGIQDRLTKPMGASFIACLVGVCLMLVETIPPFTSHSIIGNLTNIFDILMASAVYLVLLVIMYALMKLRALLLFASPFLILVMHVFHVAVNRDARSSYNNNSNATIPETTVTISNEGIEPVAELDVSSTSSSRSNAVATPATNTTTGGNNNRDDESDVHNNVGGSSSVIPNETNDADGRSNRREEHKPASLELTKVTFTGFLAVSIPRISNGSLNSCTECFMHLAAGAIVSGLIWRYLTHIKSYTANAASFCTHLCVAIAIIPFTIMAGKALS